MKTAGIAILVLGLFMTLYSGITFITKETVVDLGPVEITQDNERTVDWQPYIGVGLMVVGFGTLMLGRKGSMAA